MLTIVTVITLWLMNPLKRLGRSKPEGAEEGHNDLVDEDQVPAAERPTD